MKKQIAAIMAAAILLTSCAWQDKVGANPGEDNDKVLSVENAEAGEISKLYEGYEELQGKQIGEHIIMPEVITPLNVTDVYTFNMESNRNTDDLLERGKAFYKRFFGERYEERLVNYADFTWEGIHFTEVNYNQHDPFTDTGEEDPDNEDNGTYWGYPYVVMKGLCIYKPFEGYTSIAVYDPARDSDVSMQLDDGSFTVGEISDVAIEFYKREMEGFEGLTPIVKRVRYFRDETEPAVPHLRAEVDVTYAKDGIPAWDSMGYFGEYKQLPNGTEDTYYAVPTFRMVFGGKDSILDVRAGEPEKLTSETKVENVISLRTAAELLDENLAENLKFRIEDIQLVYCRKVTSFNPNDAAKEAGEVASAVFGEYRPYWTFIFADGDGTLAVDAITGEISVNASPVTMNELRSQHGS